MGLRDDLGRRIERKKAEITELETKIALAREYCQALEDTLKMIPKDATDAAVVLRAGTSLAKSRDAIRKAGRPLHLTELLTAIGKGSSRNERAGLSGTLAAYVRRGEIFTRPAPNTFGLVDLKTEDAELGVDPDDESVPPPGFGKL
jgi:septal ring factor EnvC (AmiA/AmiB activator)